MALPACAGGAGAKPMEHFIRTVRFLSVGCGVLAAAALFAAVLVVCQMVAIRYIFQASTVWQTDFVTYAIVGATFVGSPYVLLTKGHVGVDLLPIYIGLRMRMLLALGVSFVALAFSLLMAWAGWEYFLEAWRGGWRTETVWAPPLWILILPLPFGMSVLGLQYLADIICLVTGREAPFGIEPEEEGT